MLPVDADASDATLLLAASEDIVLQRHILGTEWSRGRSGATCLEFAALVRVLEVARAAGVRGGVACGLRSMKEERLAAPLDEKTAVVIHRARWALSAFL